MRRRVFLKRALAGLALTPGLGCNPGSRRKKPNIVLIMADDIGYECFGCYGSGQYRTPNLDELARTGIRFTHCYSQPLCTPSRVQIMTGRYNFRNYKAFGYLDPAEITFANVLKEAGYSTFIAGKWQLNGIKQYPGWQDAGRPGHFGFDEHCLWQLTHGRADGERYADPLIERDGELLTGLEDRYGPDLFCEAILDFIERNAAGPFFVYYPMALTHCPFWPTPDTPEWSDPAGRRPGDGYRGEKRYFPDMVRYLDKIIGRIVSRLNSLGLRDDTLVLFTSDNGTDRPIESKLGDRIIKGGKSEMTDAGTHVPLIANWGRSGATGTVCDDPVDFSDFLPTLAEAAAAALPGDRTIDGQSFLPQLRGQKGNPREWIFCHYWGRGRIEEQAREYVRDKRYKLYDNGAFYDLQSDPLEESPLQRPGSEAEQVRRRLQQAMASVKSGA